ncbi:hypothetical protein [Sulfurovum sp.]|uniref:hypothetical protein n=1 Tax=Sulfurovum sp. TaxID=1969726 RepID=UPI003569322D
MNLDKQSSIIAKFEYCGAKLTFSLFFLFLGICFGLGLLFLVESGERWFGLLFIVGGGFRFYEQVITSSIILYNDRIVKNRYVFNPIILSLDEIKGTITIGLFGGMLTLWVEKSLFQKQINFELGLFNQTDVELLKTSLKKLDIIVPKFNLKTKIGN